MKNEKVVIGGTGIIIGIIAVVLVKLGNPANMGFCLACFIRDTAGGLGLHRAEPVQYIRPEIMGLILGAFGVAFARKEFSVKGGSSPLLRFVLGFFVMIGCLMFLGCPFRMILRIAGGDLNAIVGLLGFVCGIVAGIVFLNKGYSLGRTYKQEQVQGFVMPIVQIVLIVLVIAAPAFIFFTPADGGPGAKHAAVIVSLVAGLIVGGIAQYTRLCMVGGIRDFILFRETRLLIGFVAILVAALVGNLVLGKFNLGFLEQPVAHNDGLWNFLGMLLAGYGCCLLGGCPLRQLVLTGEGNTDSAFTFLGLFAGAAFAHNFALAASGKGPSANGKIAVIIGLVVVTIIAVANTMKKENA
ncbi:YedE family putative selenium transporter [Lachnoanaerobaculum sp. JCM 36186]|uniref:YedE family putative selenium transporter n=1 Tax=Lachnoanaerobaculum sanguinis TaxID=3065809 RepID=UPI0027603D15|nr:YedE family putative selenium transporter [Lachnoanaerobaculum sp. JCM 36186]GMO03767.1 YedE family putative selenium transporter [Lachnoanaerobaculum sp. JCM 36186]